MFLRIGVFLLCLFFAAPAHAQVDYAAITWGDILHTMIKFNALDVMKDTNLLDEFAAITDCDLYQYYFHDDFKWNQVREIIRQSIIKNQSDYPARYHFDAKLKLDRYDFDSKVYKFGDRNPVRHINLITIFDFSGPICGNLPAQYLPLSYRAKIDPPVNIPGLEISPKAAQALLNYMDASGNDNHNIFASFKMTVIYVEPFRKAAGDPGARNDEYVYYQSHGQHNVITLDVRIDSVEFYQDQEMKHLVYTFKPT